MAVEHVVECSGLAFSQFHKSEKEMIFSVVFLNICGGRTPLLHLVKLSPLKGWNVFKVFWSESKPDQLIKTVE